MGKQLGDAGKFHRRGIGFPIPRPLPEVAQLLSKPVTSLCTPTFRLGQHITSMATGTKHVNMLETFM